jgi:hypothetical protein
MLRCSGLCDSSWSRIVHVALGACRHRMWLGRACSAACPGCCPLHFLPMRPLFRRLTGARDGMIECRSREADEEAFSNRTRLGGLRTFGLNCPTARAAVCIYDGSGRSRKDRISKRLRQMPAFFRVMGHSRDRSLLRQRLHSWSAPSATCGDIRERLQEIPGYFSAAARPGIVG